MSLYSSCS